VTTPEEFRRIMGRFASGVAVVTTAGGGRSHGMTATSFTSLSLDPLLVLVCVQRSARFHDLVMETKVFAVTVLAENQAHLSAAFASREATGWAKFDQCSWYPGPVSKAPVLNGGLAFLDCVVTDCHVGGDHSIIVGRVDELGVLNEAGTPLLWFEGTYRGLARNAPILSARRP